MKGSKGKSSKEEKVIPHSISGFIIFTFREILKQKKWILFPLWIILAAIGLLIFIGGGSAILPAIYIAF
jgi:hypothetical protein